MAATPDNVATPNECWATARKKLTRASPAFAWRSAGSCCPGAWTPSPWAVAVSFPQPGPVDKPLAASLG
eukprot:11207607-Lingulodinium_polyedra.AAC.1